MLRWARRHELPSGAFATFPWQRCPHKLARVGRGGTIRPHSGRCDLRRNHPDDHALERGFDVVFFSPDEATPR